MIHKNNQNDFTEDDNVTKKPKKLKKKKYRTPEQIEKRKKIIKIVIIGIEIFFI